MLKCWIKETKERPNFTQIVQEMDEISKTIETDTPMHKNPLVAIPSTLGVYTNQ